MATPTASELTIARLERAKALLVASMGSYNKALAILHGCVERNRHVITDDQARQVMMYAKAGLAGLEAVNHGV